VRPDLELSGASASGAPESLRPDLVQKRSLAVAGHRTSVSLETAFWDALKRIAALDGVSLAALVARVDAGRGKANLSSALRVYALERMSGAAVQANPP
jgi:predicted DNA-binding ribbon-helix-helix protein